MTNNLNRSNATTSTNNDPFLIHEDEKIFAMLAPSGQTLSKFDEIVAIIAYSQYALQKHQFVTRFNQEEGRPPSEEHIKSIIMAIRNDAALDSLKQKSDNLLKEYTKEYLAQAKREEILEPIEKIIKDNTKFWDSIWANLVAGLIYSVIVTVILFTATAMLPDNKFSKIIKILMDEKTEQPVPTQRK
jgi:hypothetical protein